MDESLAELLTRMTVAIAADQRIPIEVAAQIVRERLPHLRATYQALDAPDGDDDAGFAQWLARQAIRERTV
jgi:hypothetical protein